MKYTCIIFDCDGTLADTLEDIASAMNQSLVFHGFPEVPPGQYSAMVGWGIARLAALALPEEARTDAVIQKVAAEAARIYRGQPLVKTKPYPGLMELVTELKQQQKIKLAVLSNKPDPVLRQVIEGIFTPGTFDVIQGDRPGQPRKPDPSPVWELLVSLDREPRDTLFVGDSEIDMETACNAGCYPLGVSWGFRPRNVLEAAGAARIIDRPDEMWEVLSVRGIH
jgi:phosphoglycolate phosphatase